MRVVLPLSTRRVHGASVSRVGHSARATCAPANARPIGTRNRVSRVRFDSRRGFSATTTSPPDIGPFLRGLDEAVRPGGVEVVVATGTFDEVGGGAVLDDPAVLE